MSRVHLVWGLGLLGVLAGCAKPTAEAPAAGGNSGADQTAPTKSMDASDLALINEQKVCPVTDVKLGDHGMPYKHMVGDRAVFLCCEGCKSAIEAEPDKYLAKLDGNVPAAAPETETSAAEANAPPTVNASEPPATE